MDHITSSFRTSYGGISSSYFSNSNNGRILLEVFQGFFQEFLQKSSTKISPEVPLPSKIPLGISSDSPTEAPSGTC